MKGKFITEINLGDFAENTRTIAESDVYMFAGITGDLNPAHMNAVEAANGMFKERIAHGMLSAGLISAVLGMQLPGPGTIYMGQTLKFTAPVKFGDTITARAEVIDINLEKNRLKLRTTCMNQNNKMVLDGEALVMPPKA